MNILKLNNFYEVLGGSDRVFLNTGKLLADYGHNVHWFVSSHNYQKNNSEDVTLIEPLNRPPRAQDYPRYLYNQKARTAISNVLKTLASVLISLTPTSTMANSQPPLSIR